MAKLWQMRLHRVNLWVNFLKDFRHVPQLWTGAFRQIIDQLVDQIPV